MARNPIFAARVLPPAATPSARRPRIDSAKRFATTTIPPRTQLIAALTDEKIARRPATIAIRTTLVRWIALMVGRFEAIVTSVHAAQVGLRESVGRIPGIPRSGARPG